MKYKKSILTSFAKDAAFGANLMLNSICIAENISKSDIGRSLKNEDDSELLLEVSKRFAKYAKVESEFDADIGEVQDFQQIIDNIIECCEEHNWFNN